MSKFVHKKLLTSYLMTQYEIIQCNWYKYTGVIWQGIEGSKKITFWKIHLYFPTRKYFANNKSPHWHCNCLYHVYMVAWDKWSFPNTEVTSMHRSTSKMHSKLYWKIRRYSVAVQLAMVLPFCFDRQEYNIGELLNICVPHSLLTLLPSIPFPPSFLSTACGVIRRPSLPNPNTFSCDKVLAFGLCDQNRSY